MDLDSTWQVHLWGPMTRCVRWERIWGSSRAPSQNMQLQFAAEPLSPVLPPGEYKRGDSAFCQITLVFVWLTISQSADAA